MDLKIVPFVGAVEMCITLTKSSATRLTSHLFDAQPFYLKFKVKDVIDEDTELKMRCLSEVSDEKYELKIKQERSTLFVSFTDIPDAACDPSQPVCPSDSIVAGPSSSEIKNLTDGLIRDHTSGTRLLQTLVMAQLEQINAETSNLPVLAKLITDSSSGTVDLGHIANTWNDQISCDSNIFGILAEIYSKKLQFCYSVMNGLEEHAQSLTTQVTLLNNAVENRRTGTKLHDSLFEVVKLLDSVVQPLEAGTSRSAVATTTSGRNVEGAVGSQSVVKSYASVAASAGPQHTDPRTSETGYSVATSTQTLERFERGPDADDATLGILSSHDAPSTSTASFVSPGTTLKIEENVFETRVDKEGFKTVTYRRKKQDFKNVSLKMMESQARSSPKSTSPKTTAGNLGENTVEHTPAHLKKKYSTTKNAASQTHEVKLAAVEVAKMVTQTDGTVIGKTQFKECAGPSNEESFNTSQDAVAETSAVLGDDGTKLSRIEPNSSAIPSTSTAICQVPNSIQNLKSPKRSSKYLVEANSQLNSNFKAKLVVKPLLKQAQSLFNRKNVGNFQRKPSSVEKCDEPSPQITSKNGPEKKKIRSISSEELQDNSGEASFKTITDNSILSLASSSSGLSDQVSIEHPKALSPKTPPDQITKSSRSKYLKRRENTKKRAIPATLNDFKISPRKKSSNQVLKKLDGVASNKEASQQSSASSSKTELGQNHSKAKNIQKAKISVPVSRKPSLNLIKSRPRKFSSLPNCSTHSSSDAFGSEEDPDRSDSKELIPEDFVTESVSSPVSSPPQQFSKGPSLMSLQEWQPEDGSKRDSTFSKATSVPSFFKCADTHMLRNPSTSTAIPSTSKGACQVPNSKYSITSISRENGRKTSLNSMGSLALKLKGISIGGFFGDINLKIKRIA